MNTPSLDNIISLKIPDAVGLTGLSRTRIYDAIRHGHIVKVRAGRQSLVLASSLRAYVESLPRAAPA